MVTRFFGGKGLPDGLRAVLESHGDIIYPFIFLGFFIIGAVAVGKKGIVKQVFVIAVIALLGTSSILGVTMVPFIDAQRYSSIDSENDSTKHIVLVDSESNQIKIDERANAPYSSPQLSRILINETDNEKRVTVAEQIILDSEKYRDRVNRRLPRMEHPPSSVGTIWKSTDLEELDDIKSVQIHEIQWSYEQGSQHVDSKSDECLLKITPHNESIIHDC